MIVPMAKIQIVGHQSHVDQTLELLYQLGQVQIIDYPLELQGSGAALTSVALGAERLQELETLRYLRARLDALVQLLPAQMRAPTEPAGAEDAFAVEGLPALRAEMETVTLRVEALVQRLDALSEERMSLPRYANSMQRLLPLLPELTQLQGYETVALLLSARHARVLDLLRSEMASLVGERCEIMAAQVDSDTLGAVLVFPRAYSTQIHALLGREQVSEVRLPPQFSGVPLPHALADIEQRLQQIPGEIAHTEEELRAIVAPRQVYWSAASRYITSRLSQLEALRLLGATLHTFVLLGWTPQPALPRLLTELSERLGPEVTCYVMDMTAAEQANAPVLLANPKPAQPYEFLVRLLSVPRYGTIDPTVLMSFFLPLFFGIMLGDVAYGLILMAIALIIQRKLGRQSDTWRDLGRILFMGAVWTVVFGVVYGEFLGNLGHELGMQPLWINREQALAPLMLFSIAIGVVHVTLGLLLGVWVAWRGQHKNELWEKIGMLVALAGLFLLAATAANRLPHGFFTPAIAIMLVGMVLLIRPMGALGLLLAPIEVLSTVGNMLSYLRIAAIGLSSVYLARVANEMVGALGPVWLGVIVAVFFHALNVALGAFSPTIHSLRLHYVEFFGKFYEEGGTAFAPFGALR